VSKDSEHPPPGSPQPAAPSLSDFLGEPTRDLAAWRWLWQEDRAFPIRSHRGVWGRLLVAAKRLLRPLVRTPQNDLWERQRVFNLILLEHLQRFAEERLGERVSHLEGFLSRGVGEVMAHNDALFARVDQKLDRQGRQVRDLLGGLGAALARLEAAEPQPEEGGGSAVAALARAWEEHAYLELERRYRGTEEEIAERLALYVPYFEGLEARRGADGERLEILDLGCGRGEALKLLTERGFAARGVDASERMVSHCREQGLTAETGDLFAVLSARRESSLGGVVSFHVIEHLPPAQLDRLVRLAWRALAPGGVLILETPNPLSLVAGGRNFWLDPTHLRPVHPRALELLYRLAGFEPVEILELRPFPVAERLPEIDVETLPVGQRELADRVNRLRDRLDDLLFGCQDFAVVGRKEG